MNRFRDLWHDRSRVGELYREVRAGQAADAELCRRFRAGRDELLGYGGGRYLLATIKYADLCAWANARGARLQLRLQPFVRLQPALGLPAHAAGERSGAGDPRRGKGISRLSPARARWGR